MFILKPCDNFDCLTPAFAVWVRRSEATQYPNPQHAFVSALLAMKYQFSYVVLHNREDIG